MFVSVTRLRVRSFRILPRFFLRNYLAQRQVVRSLGFLGGRLLIDARRTFWTLTVWESEKAMKAFRGSGAHAAVMPRLPKWCNEASYTHWESTNSEVPTWHEAYEHLLKDGRLSRVENPSQDHQARRFAPPRLRPLIGQNLVPAGSS